MDCRQIYRALAALVAAVPCFGELRGGVTQIDIGSFPELNAYVSLEDEQGRFVEGLGPVDVTVKEDGIPAAVTQVAPVTGQAGGPASAVSIVLAIDNSASMLGRSHQLERAVGAFLDGLAPDDRVAVISFAGGLESDLEVRGFTADKGSAKAALDLKRLSPKTYLNDMIWRSAALLDEGTLAGRRAIVVFSDGRDLGSRYSFSQAVQRVKEVEAPVFAIELTDQKGDGNAELKALAERTGGRYYVSPNPDELAQVYQTVRSQLVKQYRVTFVSPKPSLDDLQREIEVTARSGPGALTARKTILLDPGKVKVAVAVSSGSKEELLSLLDEFPEGKWSDAITYKLGQVFEEEGKLGDAEKYYQALIEKYPDSQWSDDSYFRLAAAYRKDGNDEQALKISQDLLAKFPQSEWADDMLFQAGSIYIQRGDAAEGRKALEELVSRFPDSEWVDDAEFSFGKAYVQAGDLSRATAAFQRVIEVAAASPLADHARYELGQIDVQKGDWASAESQLAPFQADRLASEQAPEALLVLGKVYAQQGNQAKADGVYELLRTRFAGHEVVSRIPPPQPETRSAEAEQATTEYYTVQAGDWLSKLAIRYLGDMKQWPRLYELNKDTIKDPNLILVGQRIRIVHH